MVFMNERQNQRVIPRIMKRSAMCKGQVQNETFYKGSVKMLGIWIYVCH